jgi:transposase-like protein
VPLSRTRKAYIEKWACWPNSGTGNYIPVTNPIESVFATVRNRTRKTKGCLNRKTALAMVYRLMMSAKKKWRKISGPNRLPELIQGVEFKDGIKQLQVAA